MSEENTFFPIPTGRPQSAQGEAPAALFDLAINRAATALRGVGDTNAELERWHARTRFARRIPISEVQRCLSLRPASGLWHWAGGPHGGWATGKAPFP